MKKGKLPVVGTMAKPKHVTSETQDAKTASSPKEGTSSTANQSTNLTTMSTVEPMLNMDTSSGLPVTAPVQTEGGMTNFQPPSVSVQAKQVQMTGVQQGEPGQVNPVVSMQTQPPKTITPLTNQFLRDMVGENNATIGTDQTGTALKELPYKSILPPPGDIFEIVSVQVRDPTLDVRVGFIDLPTEAPSPISWHVKLKKDFKTAVTIKAIEALSKDVVRPPPAFTDPEAKRLLVDDVQKVFRRGMGLVYLEWNEGLLPSNAVLSDGVPIGQHFLPQLLMANSSSYDVNAGDQLLSGLIGMAMSMIQEYSAVPIVNRDEVMRRFVGLDDQYGWYLSELFIPPAIPNPARVFRISGLTYLDQQLNEADVMNYKLGIANTVIPTVNNKPIKSRWAVDLDSYAVTLIGIYNNYVNARMLAPSTFANLLKAHSPRGTVVTSMQDNVDLIRPYVMDEPEIMLSQLLYALARVPSLAGVILGLYIDYFQNAKLVLERRYAPEIKAGGTSQSDANLRQVFSRTIAGGSLEDLITSFAFMMAPTVVYPDLLPRDPNDVDDCVVMLLTSMLYFVLFPVNAKLVAYELCYRIMLCLDQLDPANTRAYRTRVGYFRNEAGEQTNDRISKSDYVKGGFYPSMLRDYTNLFNWPLLSQIRNLIRPIGTMKPRTLATSAGLPSISTSVFVPYYDPGIDAGTRANNEVTSTIRAVCAFFAGSITDAYLIALTGSTSRSKAQGFLAIMNLIKQRAYDVGYGLGVIVRRVMHNTVNWATNVVHAYDGTLEGPLQYPLVLVDGDEQDGLQHEVQQVSTAFQLDENVVWTLIFHTDFLPISELLKTNGDPQMAVIQTIPPSEVLDGQMGVYATASRISQVSGFLTMILTDDGVNSPGMRRIREWLTLGNFYSFLSSSSYKALERLLMGLMDKDISAALGSAVPYTTVGIGDVRILRPRIRRVNILSRIQNPHELDPVPLVGDCQLICPYQRSMFVKAADMIASPESVMSRIGMGIALKLTQEDDITLEQIFEDNDLPEYFIDNASFEPVVVNRVTTWGVRIDGVVYTKMSDVPACILTVEQHSKLEKRSWNLLLSSLLDKKIWIKLPLLRYTYSVHILSREDYNAQFDSKAIIDMINQSMTSLLSIKFFMTDLPLYTNPEFGNAYCLRIIYPLEPVFVPTLLRGTTSWSVTPNFLGPNFQVMDTGKTLDNGIPTYTDGRLKDINSISLSNQLNFREEGPGRLMPYQMNINFPSKLEYSPNA